NNDTDQIQTVFIRNRKKKKLSWYTYFLIFVDVCALICLFLAYGPYNRIRELFIQTALSTNSHKYLAYVLYSEEYAQEIANKHSITSAGETSNVDDIVFVDYSDKVVYANEYEEAVLKRDEGNDLYKVVRIIEPTFSGYMAVIYDPTRLHLYLSKSRYGSTVSTMAQETGAKIATNASGYYVNITTYEKYPARSLIVDGEVYYDSGRDGPIVGMNKDGVLMLMNSTANRALEAGMVWAIEFGPFLVVNGEPSNYTGTGGGGIHPRTCIGQRKDGIVLLIVIDGRGGGGSMGASFADLVNLMMKYGAYNACNLDGGGSSAFTENGVLLSHPVSYQGEGERNVLDALVLY
ncbi:MAG TPA: phosphodiester glycosidase family protein, partial [Erysipelotrichaceae bacterium]|nr:phosphodiester glycosidase family protein [Erysipelotrichaceae bacterium]